MEIARSAMIMRDLRLSSEAVIMRMYIFLFFIFMSILCLRCFVILGQKRLLPRLQCFWTLRSFYLPCSTSVGLRFSSMRIAGMLPIRVTSATSTPTTGTTIGRIEIAELNTECPMIWANPMPA